MKTDITMYGDNELSLMFLNDEYLYNEMCRAARRSNFEALKETVNEFYEYTEAQLSDLEETFESEIEEYNQ